MAAGLVFVQLLYVGLIFVIAQLERLGK